MLTRAQEDLQPFTTPLKSSLQSLVTPPPSELKVQQFQVRVSSIRTFGDLSCHFQVTRCPANVATATVILKTNQYSN